MIINWVYKHSSGGSYHNSMNYFIRILQTLRIRKILWWISWILVSMSLTYLELVHLNWSTFTNTTIFRETETESGVNGIRCRQHESPRKRFLISNVNATPWRRRQQQHQFVTRFGQISPLRKTFKNLRQTFEVLFCVWQNFKPTLAIYINFGQIWAVVSSQISTNNLAIWSHCFFHLMTGWLSILKSNKDEFKVSLSRRGLFAVEFAFANFFVKKSVGVYSLKISLSKAPFRPV